MPEVAITAGEIRTHSKHAEREVAHRENALSKLRPFFPLFAYLLIYPVTTGYWVQGWIDREFDSIQAVFIKAELLLPAIVLLSIGLFQWVRARPNEFRTTFGASSRLGSPLLEGEASRRNRRNIVYHRFRYLIIACTAFIGYYVGLLVALLKLQDFSGRFRPHFDENPFQPIVLWIGFAFVFVIVAIARSCDGLICRTTALRCPNCQANLFAQRESAVASGDCRTCGERILRDAEHEPASK